MAERTGTGSRSPGSRANRTPVAAATGRPDEAASLVPTEGRRGAGWARERRRRSLRYAASSAAPERMTTMPTNPSPSTIGSTATPTGYTARTGPSGKSGDRAVATTTATEAPTSPAPMIPVTASAIVVVGPAPSARSVAVSVERRRSCRLITCSATIRRARAARPPKAPTAIEMGLMARSACVMAGRYVWNPMPGRSKPWRDNSASTAPTWAAPPATLRNAYE